MTTPFEGGCRCGAVRFTCTVEPIACGYCHCRDCQYASGGPFSTVVLAPRSGVEIDGETKSFSVEAASGNTVTRRFCPECGTPLFSELSANADLLVIKAGTLDDPTWLKPAMHIWTESAQPWTEMGDGLPRFERDPA
jgi:hypothetical protein